MWCTQCGEQLEENANFCHNCGAPCEQETTEEPNALTEEDASKDAVAHCPQCGAALFPDDAYCNQCGSPVAQANTEQKEHRCPKCKTEYLPGAQFCSVCGTPLGRQSATREPYIQDSPILNGLKQVPNFICSYIKRPIKTTTTVAEESSPALPVILFIIYVIACGLQLYSMLQIFCDAFQTLVQNIFGVFAATFLVEAPLWTSMIFGVLYGLIFLMLLSGVFFGCSTILHGNRSWGNILRTTLVQSFLPSFILLAAAGLTFLSTWLGILLFFLSQITWIVLMILGLSTLSNRSQSGRFWFPLIALLFVAFLIFNIIVYKTSWQLAKNISISYDGESMTISEIMESEGITEAEDFFEAVIGDLF